ncbi:MAG: Signal peptidase I [Deltaproteobacteria bacterium ADurb.Bin510]|nr:MAG: Signal peptidase I [Deltaproteobacteria bacterium ADurb.Bin510]
MEKHQEPVLGEQKPKSAAQEWGEALIFALIIALFAKAFIIGAYRIPSSSMEDTLLKGDFLLATKFNYGLTVPMTTHKFWGADRMPERGDIIIFTFPLDHRLDFVKRVIGLPGDTIEVKNKQLLVNGQPFVTGHEKNTDDLIIPAFSDKAVRDNCGPLKVGPGQVFAMGDNRDNSYDSRFWGPVPMANIKGKALIIYFSWDSERHWLRLGRIGRLIH